ncbi:serine/threonine protein kinase [Corallococcus llansteffanensis]|uniref:non-specific serine/threonine protein kinase n=2 Tax=Corallococcus llansteffanensis TaxID=2316731 RepID=A0A3A8Q2G4_9BACT|nr:serine/threonine protein kinase [Corallococcus llansteffanensis]
MKNPSSVETDTAKTSDPVSRSSAPMDPLLGTQVGEFIIEERIGAGGMGVVYRAVHPLIGKQTAIKVMRLELVSQQQVQRLLVEARSVNAIQHPGIIDIFGFGSLPDGRPYVIMELLQGRPLSDFVRGRTRMSLESVVWVLDQMLAALGAAHQAGVVHRDLKPANVFVVESAKAPATLKLVDFGIAKLMESGESPLTSEGAIIGTPEFMAPEQIRGAAVGPATDLYAVGVMLFQMLTGVRPFQGESVQVMFAHINEPPPLPSSHVPGLPPEVDTLVLQLLAKEPALRPASADTVREQLKRIPLHAAPHAPRVVKRDAVPVEASAGANTVTSASQDGPKTRPGSRGRTVWVGVATLLLGLGAAVLWPKHPAPPVVTVAPSATPPAEAGARPTETPAVVVATPGEPPSVSKAATPQEVTPSLAETTPTDQAAPVKATKALPKTPKPVKATAPRPIRDLLAEKQLLRRLTTLDNQLALRSKGKKPPTELDNGLAQAFSAAAKDPTEKECAEIELKLDAWEKRFNQLLPPVRNDLTPPSSAHPVQKGSLMSPPRKAP